MADRQWYTAIGGKQEGPFSDQRLRERIAAGAVHADTLVWCDGMSNWARAAEIPGLMSSSSQGAAPPMPPTSVPATGALTAGAPVISDDDRLAFDPQRWVDRVWPLFWRLFVVGLSVLAVIPLPWAAPWFLRWFVERIELPGQRRVSFAGQPGDIWYIFILYALCSYASAGISFLLTGLVSLLLIPLTAFCALIITRWFFANLVWQGRTAPLQFTGGYWALLGWSVFAPLSFISIIGWAWVYTAWARWMCRNVKGANSQFVFTASGWGYLWRTVTFVLASYLLLGMPFALRWYTRWLVAQFVLVGEAAPSVASV